MLRRTACGFGSIALAGMCRDTFGAVDGTASPLAARVPHFPARAKRVIFIFMQGGPSHVDSFDFKPKLVADHDREVDIVGYRFNNLGKLTKQRMMKPLWEFKQYGQSGRWVSDLFPHLATQVDKMCFIHSMHTEGVAHGPATLFLHTGSVNQIRPSVGAWVSYGLGTANLDMPGFVTLCPTARMGGPQNYGNAFLPADYQGTSVGAAEKPSSEAIIQNLTNPGLSMSQRERQFKLLQSLNHAQTGGAENEPEIAATINSFELAWRMQMNAPKIFELGGESAATRGLYGMDDPATEDFGRQCLMARRLAESGVRYVQVNYSDNDGSNPRWDQHSKMEKHAFHAKAVDKPVAGLLQDLEARGLLEDTLVWWGGEFGRTPFSQDKDGRDHNPGGFTVWLAGGGVKAGHAHGTTDDYGFKAIGDKVHMHDLHATVLHLLGMNHERLTYRHAGRDFRLTDVYGNVVREVLA